MARSALTLLTLVLTLALVLAPAAAQRCRREPPDRSTAKTDGGGGFRIKFSGGSDKYTPGTIYTVKLMGWRTQYLSEKFTAFSLVAESSRSGLSSVRDAGSFQVFGFGLARFDPDCPSMVTQTSTVPKTEAEVLWMAPPAGAGCVTFKAVVVRSRYVWYMDDEGLTKELCEEGSSDHRPPRQPQQQEQPQRRAEGTCCACDEAKYELRFDGLWSRESHPRDFPRNEWLTHFSDVLVASHVPEVSMWKEGEPASDGLKQVAEWGYTRKLEQEMKVKGRALRTLTRAKGLWHPNVQGTTTADFRVDKKRHLLSAVTMIGPSPDWILGVSGLDLCLKNCSWMEEKVIDLGLFDAGTDSGITYEAPNAAESERQPVRAITATWPADPRAPFYGEPATPVARITLTRSRVIERSCDHQPDLERRSSASDEHDDLPRDDRPECMVTPWTEWSECSVTCGEGLSMRTREYKLPDKAQMMDCKQQLVEKVLCDAPVTCDGRPREVSDHSGLGELSGVCAMSSWSSWSPCSVTCGQGFRMRRRNYLDRMGRKKCFHDTEEKEKCMAAQECADTEPEEVDSACPVTDWSFWSPCSVTCGRGQRVRARLLLLAEHDQQRCRHVRLMEKGGCEAGRASCALDMMEAKRVCMMPREMGPCRGNFERWYFEPMKSMCVRFVYGGCRGNRNNFETFEDCQESCSVVADGGGGSGGHPAAANSLSPPAHLQTRPAPDAAVPVAEAPVDCMVTPWLPWEPCDRTCGPRGSGRQRRVRRIKVHPRSGGSPCPRRLERYRRCRGLPPCV